ncbi:MAG: HNH endonuclease family protein [Pseudonocardia sp.]|nr:HNH endonuclease family protein [Pseudonocardia sp.]
MAADGPEAGYDRDEDFGDGWAPALGPDCDVRDVVLLRDLTQVTTRKGCDVVAGTLRDPYTGAVVTGRTRAIDVDHVVPLSLAWRTGAAHWTQDERERFANDPANLLAVVAAGPDGNRAKGDDGPERWLPPVEPCGYAVKFAALTVRYELTVTEARRTAIESACT